MPSSHFPSSIPPRPTSALPPKGPPWDNPIGEAPFAFVDLEMTGLDAAHHRVIEVCVERVRGDDIVDRLVSLVRPGADASGNEGIHGIESAMLMSAPTFAEIASRILEILEGAIFVAHAAPYDLAFLRAEFARLGISFERSWYIDTLTLSRRAFALPSHSLDALCAHFGLSRPIAHRAEPDVQALREVFRHCKEALSPATARDLWEVRVGERIARAVILAHCEDAVTSARPVHVVYRPRRKMPEAFDMVVTRVITGLDPPRVIGYQLPGRGRIDLRADRILSVEPK